MAQSHSTPSIEMHQILKETLSPAYDSKTIGSCDPTRALLFLQRNPDQVHSVDRRLTVAMTPIDYFMALNNRCAILTLHHEMKANVDTVYTRTSFYQTEVNTQTKELVAALQEYSAPATAPNRKSQLENKFGNDYLQLLGDRAKAVEWFHKSANNSKNVEGKYNLAIHGYACHLDEYPKAIEIFRELYPLWSTWSHSFPDSETKRKQTEDHLQWMAYPSHQNIPATTQYLARKALADIGRSLPAKKIGDKPWQEHVIAARTLARQTSLPLAEGDVLFFQALVLLEQIPEEEEALSHDAKAIHAPETTQTASADKMSSSNAEPVFVVTTSDEANDVPIVKTTPLPRSNHQANYLEQGIRVLVEAAEKKSVDANFYLTHLAQDTTLPAIHAFVTRFICSHGHLFRGSRFFSPQTEYGSAFGYLYGLFSSDTPPDAMEAAKLFATQAKKEEELKRYKVAGDAYLFQASALYAKADHMNSMKAYQNAHRVYATGGCPRTMLCKTLTSLSDEIQHPDEIKQYVDTVLQCYKVEVEQNPPVMKNIATLAKGITGVYERLTTNEERKVVINALATLYRAHLSRAELKKRIQDDIAALGSDISPADLSEEPGLLLEEANKEMQDPNKLDDALRHYQTALDIDLKKSPPDYKHVIEIFNCVKEQIYLYRRATTGEEYKAKMALEKMLADIFDPITESKDADFKQHLLFEANNLVLHRKDETKDAPKLSYYTEDAILVGVTNATTTPSQDPKQCIFLIDVGRVFEERKRFDAAINAYERLAFDKKLNWKEDEKDEKYLALGRLLALRPEEKKYQRLDQDHKEYLHSKKLDKEIEEHSRPPLTIAKVNNVIMLEAKTDGDVKKIDDAIVACAKNMSEQFEKQRETIKDLRNLAAVKKADGSFSDVRARLFRNTLYNDLTNRGKKHTDAKKLDDAIASLRAADELLYQIKESQADKKNNLNLREQVGWKLLCLYNHCLLSVEHKVGTPSSECKYAKDLSEWLKTAEAHTVSDSVDVLEANLFREALHTHEEKLKEWHASWDAPQAVLDELHKARETARAKGIMLERHNLIEGYVYSAKEYRGTNSGGRLIFNALACVVANHWRQQELYPEAKLNELKTAAANQIAEYAKSEHHLLAKALQQIIEKLNTKKTQIPGGTYFQLLLLENLHLEAKSHEEADQLEQSFCVGLSAAEQDYGRERNGFMKYRAEKDNNLPALRFLAKQKQEEGHVRQTLVLNAKLIIAAHSSEGNERKTHYTQQAMKYVESKTKGTFVREHHQDLAKGLSYVIANLQKEAPSKQDNLDAWIYSRLVDFRNESKSAKDENYFAEHYRKGMSEALTGGKEDENFKKTLAEERKKLEASRNASKKVDAVAGAAAMPTYERLPPTAPVVVRSTASMSSAMSNNKGEGVTTTQTTTTVTTTAVYPAVPRLTATAAGAAAGTTPAFTPTIGGVVTPSAPPPPADNRDQVAACVPSSL